MCKYLAMERRRLRGWYQCMWASPCLQDAYNLGQRFPDLKAVFSGPEQSVKIKTDRKPHIKLNISFF